MLLFFAAMTSALRPIFPLDPEQNSPARGVLMVTGRADFGGGPEHVFQLAKAVARSTEVFIACPREEPYWGRYESVVGPERMLEIPHRKITFAAFTRLVRFIRVHGIDIVHAHGRTAGIYARPAALLARVRCFYTPNGSTPIACARTLLYAAVEYLLSIITRGVVAVSGTESIALAPLCAFSDRLEVIQNGVEIPLELPPPDSRRIGPLRIVHVTRFVFQKNSHLLLDIIAALRNMGQLPEFEFILLGDGPGRAEFECDLAGRGFGNSVKVLGAVSNPGTYLANAFCLVSTSRWEGLPIALLEAMARGVPAIATDVTGNKDAVTDRETGYLYDESTPRAAAQRLVDLARQPALWGKMVRAARRRAEREFSVEAMADATLRLYTRPHSRGTRARTRQSETLPEAYPVHAITGAVHSSPLV